MCWTWSWTAAGLRTSRGSRRSTWLLCLCQTVNGIVVCYHDIPCHCSFVTRLVICDSIECHGPAHCFHWHCSRDQHCEGKRSYSQLYPQVLWGRQDATATLTDEPLSKPPLSSTTIQHTWSEDREVWKAQFPHCILQLNERKTLYSYSSHCAP